MDAGMWGTRNHLESEAYQRGLQDGDLGSFPPEKRGLFGLGFPLLYPTRGWKSGYRGRGRVAGVDPRRLRLPSPVSRKRSPAQQTCYWKSEGRAAPPVPTSSSPAPPPAARAFMGTQAWTVSLKSFAPSALT